MLPRLKNPLSVDISNLLDKGDRMSLNGTNVEIFREKTNNLKQAASHERLKYAMA